MKKLSSFKFKPSKNVTFAKASNNNLHIIQPYKVRSLSKQQKMFNTINPVRPFNRFIRPKIYNTGLDPSSAFLHFMRKDSEKPYKRNISSIIKEGIGNNTDKNIRWSLGTTYKCNNKDYLPKVDPFQEYYFTPRYDDDKIKDNIYLKTYSSRNNKILRNNDNYKTLEDGNKKNLSYLNMKKKFNFNSESNSFWSPYASHNISNNFNRSSVKYNIINNEENLISGKRDMSIFEKTANNKKKGVAEYYHLQRNYEPNYSPKFNQFYNENRNGFMKYKGLFTELYDSSNKNGNIYLPFKIDNNSKKTKRNKTFNIII